MINKDFIFNILVGIFLIGFSQVGFSQTGIGTASPKTSSLLEVEAKNKGILIPRVELISTDSFSPITGEQVESLLVYNISAAGTGNTAIVPGFYYWNKTKWELLASNSDVDAKIALIQKDKLIIKYGAPHVLTNEVIDDNNVLIGSLPIFVTGEDSTLLYNTNIGAGVTIPKLAKVLDVKIFDSMDNLVIQDVTNIKYEQEKLTFYFGTKNMYSTLPVGMYKMIIKYVSTEKATLN